MGAVGITRTNNTPCTMHQHILHHCTPCTMHHARTHHASLYQHTMHPCINTPLHQHTSMHQQPCITAPTHHTPLHQHTVHHCGDHLSTPPILPRMQICRVTIWSKFHFMFRWDAVMLITFEISFFIEYAELNACERALPYVRINTCETVKSHKATSR